MKVQVNQRRLVNMMVVVAGLVLLVMAAADAMQLVKAGAINNQTEAYLDFWREQQKKQPDDFQLKPRDYDVALQGAEQASAALPDSPEQWVLKARVEDWGQQYGLLQAGIDHSSESVEKNPLLDTWRHAIALRPAWPYAWADYAMARAQLSLIDPDFETALLRANQLGPWEERVLENSALLGMHYHDWLSQPMQATLQGSLQRLTERYPYKAVSIARRYGRAGELCPWLTSPERVRECL
ncbi:hypothetical protein [Kistimonas asteriae]|uniref:hypothetical protein n=1 Tax=Kistimonas asteriae TaxID=517724 RepID=UPI001BA957FD|nr:hypothetical protein [Kistimonas asteriae]